MRATPLGEHTTQLTRWGIVNAYLVREDDGFTLVDTMIPGSASHIVATATERGAAIVRVLLTHAHGDHCGSVDKLADALPGVEFICGKREVPLLSKDRSFQEGEPQKKVRGSLPGVSTAPTDTVAEGDHVGSLRVIASPGHTPGHLSFIDERDRTLIVGDALQTLGGIAVSGVVRPLFPFPAMATWDKPTALRSARKLRALDPARLGVGHGRVLEAPAAALDEAIAAAA